MRKYIDKDDYVEKMAIPTEAEETPNCADDYLQNDKYHHSLKGCKVEMMLERSITKDGQINVSTTKHCKTHNVKCSKSGWEWGYYQGDKSVVGKRKRVSLTKLEVEDIINQSKEGVSVMRLAQRFNTTYGAIYSILNI